MTTALIHTYSNPRALVRALRKLSLRYGGQTRLVDAARAEAQRLGRRAA
jgi:hypothetical protein